MDETNKVHERRHEEQRRANEGRCGVAVVAVAGHIGWLKIWYANSLLSLFLSHSLGLSLYSILSVFLSFLSLPLSPLGLCLPVVSVD